MAENKKMGRPREHNREQIAIDIIEWAKKDDSINVNKFCALYDPPFSTKKLSEWSKEDPNFRESYEIAKSFLAFRREEWLNNELLHVKGYDLAASAYDYIIKEEKRQQAEFEAELKSKIDSNVSTEDINKFESIMSEISKFQSVRKIADNKSNSD